MFRFSSSVYSSDMDALLLLCVVVDVDAKLRHTNDVVHGHILKGQPTSADALPFSLPTFLLSI